MSTENPFETPRNIIVDATNELYAYKFHIHLGIDKVKELIRNRDVKTIEQYTGKTTTELESLRPGITTAFNSLVAKLQKPDLTEDEFREIMNNVNKIKH